MNSATSAAVHNAQTSSASPHPTPNSLGGGPADCYLGGEPGGCDLGGGPADCNLGGGPADCDLAFLAHCLSDDLHAPTDTAGATCLGIPWVVLLDLVGGPAAVWAEGEARTLWNARLFPVHTPAAPRRCEEHQVSGGADGSVNGGVIGGSSVSSSGVDSSSVKSGGVNGGVVGGASVNSSNVSSSNVNSGGVNGGVGACLPLAASSLFGWLLEVSPPPPGWASAPRVSMSAAAARAAVRPMLRARRDRSRG